MGSLSQPFHGAICSVPVGGEASRIPLQGQALSAASPDVVATVQQLERTEERCDFPDGNESKPFTYPLPGHSPPTVKRFAGTRGAVSWMPFSPAGVPGKPSGAVGVQPRVGDKTAGVAGDFSREARRALIAEMCTELSPVERAIARELERRG